MHGRDVIIEETLDWRPVDYFTIGVTLPVPGSPRIVMTRALRDGPNGTTHLEMRIAKPKPKDKAFVEGATGHFADNMNEAIAGLRSMVEGRAPAIGEAEEPTLKPSTGRFLTEPMKSRARGGAGA
jgi:hypothetical protein